MATIEVKRGDLLAEDAEALVNAVNCVGVMGRGIAAQFKRAWPENFAAYAAACRRREVLPGHMFVFATGRPGNPRFIVNFPTKRHWRDPSRMEDIESGFEDLCAQITTLAIRSIAMPALGAGLGGLAWPRVRSCIEAALVRIPQLRVYLFEPFEARSA